MYETIMIIKEYLPPIVIWENVPNILSEGKKKHIRNFNNYLTIMEKFGYKNYYMILNATNFGIPQDRSRVFTISLLGEQYVSFPLEQVLEKSYVDFLEENYTDYNINIILKNNHLKRVKGIKEFSVAYGYGGHFIEGNIFPTLLSCYGAGCGNGGTIKCKEGYRRLTPRECWRIMGFTDDEYDKAATVCPPTALTKQAGNSIVVNVLVEIYRCLFSKDRLYRKVDIIDEIIKLLSIENWKVEKEKAKKQRYSYLKNQFFILEIENFESVRNEVNIKKRKYIDEKGIVNLNVVNLLEIINFKFSEVRFANKEIVIKEDELLKFYKYCCRSKITPTELVKLLKILKSITIKRRINSGMDEGKYPPIRIFNEDTRVDKENKKVHLVLSNELYEIIKNEGTYIYIPPTALSSVNANLAYKFIVEQKIANVGTEKEDIINIAELLEVMNLQRYEEHRNHFERIKTEFDQILKSFNTFEFEYDREGSHRYKIWKNANLIISWKEEAPFRPIIDEAYKIKKEKDLE